MPGLDQPGVHRARPGSRRRRRPGPRGTGTSRRRRRSAGGGSASRSIGYQPRGQCPCRTSRCGSGCAVGSNAVQVADLALEPAGRVARSRPGSGPSVRRGGPGAPARPADRVAGAVNDVDDPEPVVVLVRRHQCQPVSGREQRRDVARQARRVRRARTRCASRAVTTSSPRTAAARASSVADAGWRRSATTAVTTSASARGSRGPCADRSGSRRPSAPPSVRATGEPGQSGEDHEQQRRGRPPSPTASPAVHPPTTMPTSEKNRLNGGNPSSAAIAARNGTATPGRRASRPRTSSIRVDALERPGSARTARTGWPWSARDRARAAARRPWRPGHRRPRRGRAGPCARCWSRRASACSRAGAAAARRRRRARAALPTASSAAHEVRGPSTASATAWTRRIA